MTERWEIGNIDNSPIGSTTPAAGAFTTLAASGNVTPANLTASKPVFTDASKHLVSTGTLGVNQGGTGATTLTDHALVAGSGAAAVTPLAAATNGQLPIGSTGADPVIATLTEGEGIDITNGAGTITIAGEDASATNKGIVELATDAETVTGSSTTLVTTPANITARLAAPGTIGGTTPGAGNFTTIGASGNITPAALTASKLVATDGSKILVSVEPTVFERGGAQEINGDHLDIDFTPTNYTPDTTPAEVANVDDLSAHLAGIDNALGNWYGVTWNQSTDAYTRRGSLASFATGSSPGNALLPVQAAMRRCVVSDAGVVQYYLDPDDSTLKADGSAANLDGTDGQVMVEIPKFYMRYSYAANVHTWDISLSPLAGFTAHPAFFKDGAWVDYRYFSAYEGSMWDATTSDMVSDANAVAAFYAAGDKLCSITGQCPKTNETRAEFRAMASERGTGWRQQDYFITTAIQLLYLVEYADFDSQTCISNGRTMFSSGAWTVAGTGNGDYIGRTGYSNAIGNASGGSSRASALDISAIDTSQAAYNDYMSYRGIENFFGNVWKWVDGINIGMAGTHDGGNNEATVMTDSGEDWPVNSLVGATIVNTTDGSSGVITANTGTTVTVAALTGGTDNDWDTGDAYTISHIPWVCNDETTPYADDVYAGYDRLVDVNGDPVTLHNANVYPGTIEQIQAGFLAASGGGANNTHLCDYYYQDAGWRVVCFGGNAHNTLNAGAFYVYAYYSAASAIAYIGGRLCF